MDEIATEKGSEGGFHVANIRHVVKVALAS